MKLLGRIALALGAFAALSATAGTGASAQARYRERPPVEVSPDLEREWLLQVSPGSGVVPGYSRPSLNAIAMERRSVRPYPVGAVRPAYENRRAAIVREPQQQQPATAGVRRGFLWGAARMAPSRSQPRDVAPQGMMDPKFLPQDVMYQGREKPGTIVVDTRSKFLYHVGANGMARRYGVGVGKEGFGWKGTQTVSRKAEWPTWHPPSQMRAREAAKGRILPVRMEGGPGNPLGARALYLGSTLYRIHGTNQPWTIGQSVSSGCIRMRNEDVIDLYGRVKVGARVKVI